MNQREVTSKEFFAALGDVEGRVIGPWPYTTVYEEKSTRREVGRVVGTEYSPGLSSNRYYLSA